MTFGKTMTYAVALASAATLALAGCSGGDEKPTPTQTPTGATSSPSGSGGSPSVSGSATGSPSTSPTSSVVVPHAARAHTEVGAVEFAKFFITEADRAYVTVNTSALQSLSGPSCENCDVAVEGVNELKAAGRHQSRPAMTVVNTNPLPGGTPDSIQVQVQTRSDSVEVVDKSGTTVDTTDASPAVYLVSVRWMGNRWVAADFGIQE